MPTVDPAARPPRAGSRTEIAAWTVLALVAFSVLVGYAGYIVVAALGGASGDAFSWFYAVLALPVVTTGCWWATRHAVRAARRPAPPSLEPVVEPRTHATFADDAAPPPTRW